MKEKGLITFLILIVTIFFMEISCYGAESSNQENEAIDTVVEEENDNKIKKTEATEIENDEQDNQISEEIDNFLQFRNENIDNIEKEENNIEIIDDIDNEYEGNNEEELNDNSQTVEDGIYRIETALDLNKVLDISEGSTKNNANLQIWTDKNKDQQKFVITYIAEEECYEIKALHSGKFLDVQNENKNNGANVQQYEAHDVDAQKWIIKETQDGYYNIISKCNNLYLDICGADTSNGTNVQMYEQNGTNAQKFNLVKLRQQELKNGQEIEDGIYNIKLALDSNKVLDISEGSKKNGANLQIWKDSNVLQQEFIITFMEDGYYKIQVLHSNKVLDVQGANKNNGANVQQYESNDTDAQRWIIKKTQDGYYNMISKCNNLYLDICGANTSNGTNVQMYKGNGTKAQKFIFIDVNEKNAVPQNSIEDGVYKIECLIDLNKVLDISEGSKANRANLQIWRNSNVQQQKFIVTATEDGYYKIQSVNSGKYLDVQDASKNNGANVQQYEVHNVDAQKWIIKETKDGYYSIVSKCNNLYMDICGANTSNGTNVHMYKGNESNAQKFKFIKTQIIDNGTYEILTSVNGNMAISIDIESQSSDCEMQLMGYTNSAFQKYFFEYQGNNEYIIRVKNTDKVLTVEEDNINNGAKVFQYLDEQNERQKWILEVTNDGEYNIKSKYNNLYLDIKGGVIKQGTKIQMYEKNNTDAQKFRICNVYLYRGIDVSDWQGTIDWDSVKKSGVEFAILRIGYGRHQHQKDNQFERNYNECKRLNIPVGIYLYSYAQDIEGAYLEAQNCLTWLNGRTIELPIFYDLEDDSISNIGTDTITNMAITFKNIIEQNGYKAGVYANLNWLTHKIDVLRLGNCEIWLAHYTWSENVASSYEGKYSIWQYSSKGIINGIEGNVDLDIRYA